MSHYDKFSIPNIPFNISSIVPYVYIDYKRKLLIGRAKRASCSSGLKKNYLHQKMEKALDKVEEI